MLEVRWFWISGTEDGNWSVRRKLIIIGASSFGVLCRWPWCSRGFIFSCLVK